MYKIIGPTETKEAGKTKTRENKDDEKAVTQGKSCMNGKNTAGTKTQWSGIILSHFHYRIKHIPALSH